MAAPIPTLGWPSRSAAIANMLHQGISIAEVANKIGISQNNVMALDASYRRKLQSHIDKAQHLTPTDWHRIRNVMRTMAHNTEYRETLRKLEMMG